MLLQIMNSAGLNSKNIVNTIDIFNDSVFINNSHRQITLDEHCFLQIFLG